MKHLTALIALGFAAVAVPATALAQAAAASAAAKTMNTTDTDFGTIWANPASKAILVKYFPDFAKPEMAGNLDMMSSMTLRSLAQVKPDYFTDDKLNAIDAELAKLPVH